VRIALIAAAALACGLAACGQPEPTRDASGAADANASNSDWGRFGGHREEPNSASAHAIHERPTEITGVPYIRAFRLAWTRSTDVPTWEPDNQTRRLPTGALQAVLLVDVTSLPREARLRVLWYYADALAFTDALAGRDDGEHLFSLVKREGGRLAPLPAGAYRVEVHDGASLLRSIPFEIEGAR
jgi:hypothetical protein